MENSENPPITIEDPQISRLRELQKMQNGGRWTEENRQELLSLQSNLHLKEMSDDEKNALLRRQSTAGQDGQPSLSETEKNQIQRLNGLL